MTRETAERIALAMCGDDHLTCTYPDCGCKIVPSRLPAVMAIVDALVLSARADGERDMRERAALVALEQRCERDTPWDLACTTIAASIRALKDGTA